MKILSRLYPNDLWEIFEEICNIPHPSKHEEKIVKYVKDFGEKLGLETIVDEIGNVIIKKPATKGMENRQGVILQGHLDMVPQKNSDIIHDFLNDPIKPIIDGEWVKARGTTLGADNGIGCAAALAVLKNNEIQHGPLEVLLTVDEEDGMTGALKLKAGLLRGDILINLDSEDEGELYIGCAGGIDANVEFNVSTEQVDKNSKAYKISLTGLKGGHSGLDINLGRGNSNKIMFRFLYNLSKIVNINISYISGGNLRNAIPRETFVDIIIDSKDEKILKEKLSEFEKIITSELSATEDNIKMILEEISLPNYAISKQDTERIIKAINACTNGVIRMSDDMPGLVETSTNLAIVKTEGNNKVIIKCLLRSSVDTAKQYLCEVLESQFLLAGAKIDFSGEYPGWKPNVNSTILRVMKEIYEKKYNKTPQVKAIHAGLECGLFSRTYPRWDMISFGPTIRHPHSPDEKVHIASVGRFWDYLIEVLKNIPQKTN